MSLVRQRVGRVLRDVGLLSAVENLRYMASVARLHGKNRRFVAANPGFELPPPALAYDAYSAPDWTFYKQSGLETAAFLAGIARKYALNAGTIRVLEWGCGPGRVIRHLPAALGAQAEVHGSDYNPETIAWCKGNIPNVRFALNLLNPPLAFEAGSFDFIYAISVLTHLSESVAQQWLAELFRVTRAGGALLLTTNGDSRRRIMLPDELRAYETAGVVIRDKYEEGKRSFLAIHSPDYARRRLFAEFEILQYVPAAFPHTEQDYWVLRKPRAGEQADAPATTSSSRSAMPTSAGPAVTPLD